MELKYLDINLNNVEDIRRSYLEYVNDKLEDRENFVKHYTQIVTELQHGEKYTEKDFLLHVEMYYKANKRNRYGVFKKFRMALEKYIGMYFDTIKNEELCNGF